MIERHWSDLGGRAGNGAFFQLAFQTGDAEIRESGLPSPVNHHIRRFEVAMQDARQLFIWPGSL